MQCEGKAKDQRCDERGERVVVAEAQLLHGHLKAEQQKTKAGQTTNGGKAQTMNMFITAGAKAREAREEQSND